MTIQLVFLVLAIIFMFFDAFGVPSRGVKWFSLAWAFVICAYVFGGLWPRTIY